MVKEKRLKKVMTDRTQYELIDKVVNYIEKKRKLVVRKKGTKVKVLKSDKNKKKRKMFKYNDLHKQEIKCKPLLKIYGL